MSGTERKTLTISTPSSMCSKSLKVNSGIPWQEVAVVVILDGRRTANETVHTLPSAHKHTSGVPSHICTVWRRHQMLEYCQDELKVYDPTLLKVRTNDRPVMMHLFEKTVRLSRHHAQRQYYEPLQVTHSTTDPHLHCSVRSQTSGEGARCSLCLH